MENQNLQLIKKETNLRWIIVRPNSIWGPGFTTYKNFFFAVKNKWFFKIKDSYPQKSYGFIYNIIYQINCLIRNEKSIGKVYYLGDYEPMIINNWASILLLMQWGVKDLLRWIIVTSNGVIIYHLQKSLL